MYIYIDLFIYIKDQQQYVMHQQQQQLFQVLQSSEQNYRDIQHTPFKKKKVKKQNLRKQQSSVTVVVPGTIFFLITFLNHHLERKHSRITSLKTDLIKHGHYYISQSRYKIFYIHRGMIQYCPTSIILEDIIKNALFET